MLCYNVVLPSLPHEEILDFVKDWGDHEISDFESSDALITFIYVSMWNQGHLLLHIYGAIPAFLKRSQPDYEEGSF